MAKTQHYNHTKSKLPCGIIYAPYIPLMMSNNINYNELVCCVPLWLGDTDGEIHNRTFESFRNSLDPKFREVVLNSINDFTEVHSKEKFVLSILGNGRAKSSNIVFYLMCVFNRLYVDVKPTGNMSSEWTTPLRMEFTISKENLDESTVRTLKNRLVYGGQFYATGCVECSSEIDDNIIHMELSNIYWEDYRSKKKEPRKIL
jgi:hypothetical protein